MIVAYVIKAIVYVLYSNKDTKKQIKCIRDMSSFFSVFWKKEKVKLTLFKAILLAVSLFRTCILSNSFF